MLSMRRENLIDRTPARTATRKRRLGTWMQRDQYVRARFSHHRPDGTQATASRTMKNVTFQTEPLSPGESAFLLDVLVLDDGG